MIRQMVAATRYFVYSARLEVALNSFLAATRYAQELSDAISEIEQIARKAKN